MSTSIETDYDCQCVIKLFHPLISSHKGIGLFLIWYINDAHTLYKSSQILKGPHY